MPLENNIWEFSDVDQTIVDDLKQQLNIEEVIAQILVSRKITSFNEAKQFFRPQTRIFWILYLWMECPWPLVD